MGIKVSKQYPVPLFFCIVCEKESHRNSVTSCLTITRYKRITCVLSHSPQLYASLFWL